MCQQTSARPLTDPSEPRKVALGDSQERPRAPSGPPSDPPRSSPEPPSQKHANGCRGSTNSGRPAGAPGTGGGLQPPPLIVYVLTLSHRSSRLSVLSGLPPRRTLGVGGLTGLRPLPPTPKREVLRMTIERGLRRFITFTFRRTLKPRSFMSATPQTSPKTILRIETASADLRQGARGASRRRKSIPGEPPERPGAPSEPPSGTPGRPGEPPRPDIANRSRGSTSSTARPGAPGTVWATQPPAP